MDSDNGVHAGTIIEHLASSNKTTFFSVPEGPKVPSRCQPRREDLRKYLKCELPSRRKRARCGLSRWAPFHIHRDVHPKAPGRRLTSPADQIRAGKEFAAVQLIVATIANDNFSNANDTGCVIVGRTRLR